MGTSLSRIHSRSFNTENCKTMHKLFSIMDYLLLEKKNRDFAVTRTRQEVLRKTRISLPLALPCFLHCTS